MNPAAYLIPLRKIRKRYGKQSQHGIDVYDPRGVAKPISTDVFFYGGGWTAGSKQHYRFVGPALAERGFRVCIPDYRLHPEASLAEIQQDARGAFKAIANQYPGEDLFLLGTPRALTLHGVWRQMLIQAPSQVSLRFRPRTLSTSNLADGYHRDFSSPRRTTGSFLYGLPNS